VPSTKSWDAPVKSKGKEKNQGKTDAQISSNGGLPSSGFSLTTLISCVFGSCT
jgi:hypothetical protein